MMDDLLLKMKEIRNLKGFSCEYMAEVLHISTSAYRKIETGETKLTVERLFQISEILKTPVGKLLGSEKQNVFYQNNNDHGTFNGYYDVENYYHQENREVTQKLIQTMEQEIAHLRKEVDSLQEILKK